MAKDIEEEAPVYGGPDAAAEYMGLDPAIYQRDDGSWDFALASQHAGERTAAGDSYGNLVFGGVATDTPQTVQNPQPVPDTDFAGTLPGGLPLGEDGQIDWSNWGSGSPSGESDFSGFDGGVTGVDQGYQATDWGGQESPWQGGGINQDFYNDQFGQLLGQRNDFQQQQTQARAVREANAANPQEAAPIDWSWANSGQGLKDVYAPTRPVNEAGEPESATWGLRHGAKGDTNSALFAGLGDIWKDNEADAWAERFSDQGTGGQGNTIGDSQMWGSFDNPTAYMQNFKQQNPDAGGEWTQMNQKLANNLYQQFGGGNAAVSGGMTVPYGYAAPV